MLVGHQDQKGEPFSSPFVHITRFDITDSYLG